MMIDWNYSLIITIILYGHTIIVEASAAINSFSAKIAMKTMIKQLGSRLC
jgi:hypothetical protein